MKAKKQQNLLDKTEASFELFEKLSRQRVEGRQDERGLDLKPVLRVVQGPLLGEYWILNRSEITIGRDSTCQIVIKDNQISRRHCRIIIDEQWLAKGKFKMQIEDLGSRNGVRLNDYKLQDPEPLQNGDQIRIGSNLFGLYFKFPEEIELESYLYKLATRDPTTGLVTRAFFKSTLEFEFKRSQRYKRPMTFVIMDIDHFKSINDNFGHTIGDEVLAKVGEIIHEELRFEDTAIRFGGEEFAMILPETQEDDAFILVERIRVRLERLTFRLKDSTFKVTASFGISQVKNSISTPQLLVETADRALLEAKRSGRNRTIFASKMAS